MKKLWQMLCGAAACGAILALSAQAQASKSAAQAKNKTVAAGRAVRREWPIPPVRRETDPIWTRDRANGFAVGGDIDLGENGLFFADGTALSADRSGLYFENPEGVALSEDFSTDPAARGWTFATDNPSWGLACWWNPSNQAVVLYHTTAGGGGSVGLAYRGPGHPLDVYTLSVRLAANYSDVETASLVLRVWDGDTQVSNHVYGFDYPVPTDQVWRATFTSRWDRIEIGAAGDRGPFLLEADDVLVTGIGGLCRRIDVEADPHAVLADGSRPVTGPLTVHNAIIVGHNTVPPVAGMIRFDPATARFEGYTGTAWISLGP